MGGSSSKSRGQIMSANPQQVPPEPPYPGPCPQYHFINTEVTMSTVVSFSFMANRMVTSNVDAYYPLFAEQYAQGFRLLSFYHIPGQVRRTGGFFSMDVLTPFQGIFCRYPARPETQAYQIRIEKSVIQPQVVWNGFISTRCDVVTDIQHLFQTIANNTQNGGRLICIELTGQEQLQHSFSYMPKKPAMGCDLFFEIPVSGGPVENYVYNVTSVPIMVTVTMSFQPVPRVECDWLGILAQHLNQGWRLVEIFMDQTESQQARGFGSAQQTINAQWFFEKPASRVNDPTPLYQGTIVEHMITMKAGLSGVKTKANWEPVIQEMGNKGWELACILETPEIIPQFSGAQQKVLLFFQRPLIALPQAQPPPLGFVGPPPTDAAAPPPYNY